MLSRHLVLSAAAAVADRDINATQVAGVIIRKASSSMPSALLTADNAKLTIEAIKPDGKQLGVTYSGWDC